MIRSIVIPLVAALLFTACGISEKDRDDINALTDIYYRTRNSRDMKSLKYILSPDSEMRDAQIKQFRLQTQYFGNIRFTENWRRLSDSIIPGSSPKIKTSYNIVYLSPEKRIPVMKYGCVITLTFENTDKGWKITDNTKKTRSCSSIPPDDVQSIFHSLKTRSAALNNADIKLFTSIIAPDYSLRESVIDDVRKNMETFSTIHQTLRIRELVSYSPRKKQVKMRQVYDLLFKLPGQPDPQHMRDRKEILTLREYNGIWKIRDGLSKD